MTERSLYRRENDPALYRRRLRSELRKARQQAGLEAKQVQREMEWSPAKLSRIEAGTVTITKNDLLALLRLYGVRDKEKIDKLVEVARLARVRSPWWFTFHDVASPELLVMCGHESSASVIYTFEPLLIPGLLQTEDYARELLRHLRGPKEPKRTEGLVRMRMHRQGLLEEEDRELRFLLDESVIRRIVGGPEVMRTQLKRLQELTAYPSVSIGILPFTLGMYRSLRVPYVVFEFEDPEDETVLYIENPQEEMIIAEEATGATRGEGEPTPQVYLEIFFDLEEMAEPLQESAVFEDALAKLDQLTDE